MERLAQTLEAAKQSRRISADEAKSLHVAFLARDAAGTIWTVGLRTRAWHRQEEDEWVADNPPGELYIDQQLLARLEALAAGSRPAEPPARPSGAAGDVCPACGAAMARRAMFCTQCGSRRPAVHEVPGKCPACQAPVSLGARFCLQCGKPLSAPSGSPFGESRGVVLAEAVPEKPQPRRCPNPRCGQTIPAGKNFCTACGWCVT
jgi:hypothetical protein